MKIGDTVEVQGIGQFGKIDMMIIPEDFFESDNDESLVSVQFPDGHGKVFSENALRVVGDDEQ